MTASVPDSDLTSDQLLKLSGFDRPDADDLDAAFSVIGLAGGGVRVFNVADYGTTDTPSNTRAAMLAAGAAADAVGGGLVYWTGTLTLDRDGVNAWAITWPYSGVGLVGDGRTTVLKAQSGMPAAAVALFRMDELVDIDISGIVFDGNWGNCVTEIAEGSHGVSLPQATIYVEDTTNAPASGTITIRVGDDTFQYVTYTGKTATTFTGCSGGTGTLVRHDPVVTVNAATGINHSDQATAQNNLLMFRGCQRVRVERCTFQQAYGDGVWIGNSQDDDLKLACRDIKIRDCVFDTGARNGVSFVANVWDVEVSGCKFVNIWTCAIDSEPQGFDVANRQIWIHHNYCRTWDFFPGGGEGQCIGIVAGTPIGYNNSSSSRGWRVHDNVFEGWCAIQNSIDVEIRSNEFRTRFNSLGDTIISAINTGTETFTANNHGLKTGDGQIYILTDGTLPGGVTASGSNPLRSINYWAIRVDDNNFRIATTFAQALTGTTDVNVTSGGTGTITLTGPKLRSPIWCFGACDDIRILDNYIYDNSEKSQNSGEGHNGAIAVENSASGTLNLQPAGVIVRGNNIHAHKNVHGIWVQAVGGFSTGDGTSVIAPLTGTATSSDEDSVFDGGSPFGSTDSWKGWQIIMGGAVGLIKENTADTVTLYKPDLPLVGAIGWRTPTGEWCPTPAAGPYVITSTSGVCQVDGNSIDCGDYGDASAGGNGIYLFNDRAGGRITCTGNKIKNVTGGAIYVNGAATKPALFVEIAGNKVWDDQATPTCTGAVEFASAASLSSIVKRVIRNNARLGGVSADLVGVAASYWLVSDGDTQQWAGYGSPNTVITAPLGSTFQRKDGGAGTSFYVNENGGTTWAAK